MIAVVDASGIMQILFKTDRMERCNAILQEASLVLAPDLYIAELTNVFWKYCAAGTLSDETCLASIQDGLSYVDRFQDSSDLWREAFAESLRNRHSVYDMLYLVLARRNSAVLVTADSDLAKLCKRQRIETSL